METKFYRLPKILIFLVFTISVIEGVSQAFAQYQVASSVRTERSVGKVGSQPLMGENVHIYMEGKPQSYPVRKLIYDPHNKEFVQVEKEPSTMIPYVRKDTHSTQKDHSLTVNRQPAQEQIRNRTSQKPRNGEPLSREEFFKKIMAENQLEQAVSRIPGLNGK